MRTRRILMKLLISSLLIGMQLSLFQPLGNVANQQPAGHQLANQKAPVILNQEYPTGAKVDTAGRILHAIDLKRWGIRNDGTKAVETTKGINKALQWASKNGITAVTLPKGVYLIDKNSRINMVSNMLFQLPEDAVIQKETNAKELYHTLYIGHGVQHVTIKGGQYKGDKDQHNYSKKDNPYSSGTHEGGYGITLEGAKSVTIDGVSSTGFTGDGLMIGGFGSLIMDLYENSFVSGEFNDKGKPIDNKEKIRTSKPLRLDHALFKQQKTFEISNPIKLPGSFDLYFFDKSNSLVQKLSGKKARDVIAIPDKAVAVHLVFKKANSKGAYIELWSRTVSSNIVVRNSEFAYNRRQGITVGGADQVLIEGNELHHMKGTMPQSGIDVEGGYHYNGHFNSNIYIKNNKFHSNASYDLILYDGVDAIVEGNHMASKGAIGLAISEPFKGATITNNHFDGSRIFAYHHAVFKNNKMNHSMATFLGTNVKIDGMAFTDATLSLTAKEAFGITASNLTFTSRDKKLESGLALWGKPVKLSNVTIVGESALRTVSGGIEPGSVIDGLKVSDYNAKFGLSLPPATYNNCEFSGAEGGSQGFISLSRGGKYAFNNCKFKASTTAGASIIAEHPQLDLTIKNSSFELLGNSQAVSVQAAKNALIENNIIVANNLTNDKLELIRINDYWKREDKVDVLKAIIRGNSITANLKAVGISTIYAGEGAPSYVVEDNRLVNARLALKENDQSKNNTLK